MKIAIIGSGAAGLSAFWSLNRFSEHHVEIFESDEELGGHAHAIPVQVPGKERCWVDTAFVMLNRQGYPTFWQFLQSQGIPLVKTDTSFSVTQGDSAWGSRSLSALFATPGSLFSFRLWRMVFDLFRFHYASLKVLDSKWNKEMSVGEYLHAEGYGDGFKDDYLVPLAATYWSLPPARVLSDCPIAVLVRNFHNHGLLQIWDRPIWYTIKGGSRTYIEDIVRSAPQGSVHRSTHITAVRRTETGMVVLDAQGDQRVYDHVIMATHADITLRLLQAGNSVPLNAERALMAASEWSRFEIVMHHDETSMPPNRDVWGAWNTLLPDRKGLSEKLLAELSEQSVSCTFDMNRLHNIPISTHGHILGTMNPPQPIDPSKVFARFIYSTPIFTHRLVSAQKVLKAMDNGSGLFLVGAWTELGTHEDAWFSGISAATKLGADVPLDMNVPPRGTNLTAADLLIQWFLIGLQFIGNGIGAVWYGSTWF